MCARMHGDEKFEWKKEAAINLCMRGGDLSQLSQPD